MKRKTVFLSTFIIALVSTLTIVAASSNSTNGIDIRAAFDSIKSKLDQVNHTNSHFTDASVAEVNGIYIDKEDFTFYKYNVELTHSLRKALGQAQTKIPHDKNLIENMISEELLVQEAINRGITVSDKEIDEMIAYQREIFETHTPESEGDQAIFELMENRIRITGLTDDEFWSSDFVREYYKKSIQAGNLALYMLDNNEITDIEQFHQFRKDLYSKVQDQIKYNEPLLAEINNLR